MFKIYLNRQLHELEESNKTDKPRNRRSAERFDVTEQNILALNDVDMLRIKDISLSGFSCLVSERAYERFSLSDVYLADLKYGGQTLEANIKVAWKADSIVGFELISPTRELLGFFQRLVHPMEVAKSLSATTPQLISENQSEKTWYHSDDGCDFLVWRSSDLKTEAWQLVTKDFFIEWSLQGNLETGTVKHKKSSKTQAEEEEETETDDSPNIDTIRLAIDILMALSTKDSHAAIDTLQEGPWDFVSRSIKRGEN